MSAASQILGFALFLAVAFLWALIIGLCRAAKSHRPAEATPPAGSAGRCTTNGCPYPAALWVLVRPDLGGELRKVCHGCHDEGWAKKWWRVTLGGATDVTAFDVAVAYDAADLDDIDTFVEKWGTS